MNNFKNVFISKTFNELIYESTFIRIFDLNILIFSNFIMLFKLIYFDAADVIAFCHRIDRGPLNIKPRHRASSLTQPSASRLTDYAKQSRIAPTEEHWVIKTFHLLCFYPLSNVL